ALLALAGGFAGRAGGIGVHVHVAQVSAGAVDRELDRPAFALEHARALHARDATCVLHPRGDLALEPAHGAGRRGARVGEAPGTAAPLALAARRAGRRIGRTHGEVG